MSEKNNNLNILSYCATCKNRFGAKDVILISEQERKTTFHATCVKCHTSAIILLSGGQKGIAGVGIITDLSKDEAVKKLKMGKITADEILDVYSSVKKLND